MFSSVRLIFFFSSEDFHLNFFSSCTFLVRAKFRLVFFSYLRIFCPFIFILFVVLFSLALFFVPFSLSIFIIHFFFLQFSPFFHPFFVLPFYVVFLCAVFGLPGVYNIASNRTLHIFAPRFLNRTHNRAEPYRTLVEEVPG